MSGEYEVFTTTQGDTWDSMAYDLYGDEKYMQLLIEANWSLIDYLVFPSGIDIIVPTIIPEEIDEDAPFWRQDDDEEDDDEFFSSVEYPDDWEGEE